MEEKGKNVKNLFVHEFLARNYATARPYFHEQVIELMLNITQQKRFEHGLDVACGTGHSSRALAEVSAKVEAVDISSHMIEAAQAHPRVNYQVNHAEKLPFADKSFEIITVGLAFHWFEQVKFLKEAHRCLRDGGWLFIYNSRFAGEMQDVAEFKHWYGQVYQREFPMPARHLLGPKSEMAKEAGFALPLYKKFTHVETYNLAQLKNYLMTHTNIIDAIESQRYTPQKATEWLERELSEFFGQTNRQLVYNGELWALRKTDTAVN